MTRFRRLLSGLALLAAFTVTTSARADVVYQVYGDLSALGNGTAGLLDFQFNPGNSGYDAATARISGFTETDLTLGTATPTGGGSGTLPGLVTLNNSSGFNEVYQQFTVSGAGASFQFLLTLSGAAINNPSPGDFGHQFRLGVVDPNFNPLYGDNDPVLRIDINPGNSVPSVVTVISPPISISAVPEPSVTMLCAVGLGALGLGRVARGRSRRVGDV